MNFSVDDLAKMLMIRAFVLDRNSSSLNVYTSYCSNWLSISYNRKNDEKHYFRMDAYLKDKDVKNTLINYIRNVQRLEREYSAK